ncbi:hypothetical protein E3P92_03998 [Wallemia ichthyophaga]|uniref:Uncharacterized protein n=2 Tax=Wallemia ichthyophaga TaxID=245174 RepID=A0A4T0GY36_WALIC|nr:uncharacterized protein J056_000802 [Wallemia ichthyophaga EXF-994]TIA68493.1 hypothetical protein E3P91_04047 [Wallemia ichthyophaga]EOR00604.1 hypothetical protein J056_000802 [Wallemia ichthyophaga EXF-994]TIA78724.1 hypothetical protein E3P98_03694 [Wallemia ichthyophaga]TIA87229.1 hypothetical protein E3P97_04020 [Wallemia ichthyophaga]TIA94845.1 hypothetical protein E3P95_04033 [Wallemia ichthyophaga]
MTIETGDEKKVYKIRLQLTATDAAFQDIFELINQTSNRVCTLLQYESAGIYRWLDVVSSYNSLYRLQHEYYGGAIIEDFVLINNLPPPY